MNFLNWELFKTRNAAISWYLFRGPFRFLTMLALGLFEHPNTKQKCTAATHNHPQTAVVLLEAPTNSHNFAATNNQQLFHHHHPQLRTLLKNELFQNYFSTTLHNLAEHAF